MNMSHLEGHIFSLVKSLILVYSNYLLWRVNVIKWQSYLCSYPPVLSLNYFECGRVLVKFKGAANMNLYSKISSHHFYRCGDQRNFGSGQRETAHLHYTSLSDRPDAHFSEIWYKAKLNEGVPHIPETRDKNWLSSFSFLL